MPERIPSVPPIIPVLPDQDSRPFWSVMIPCFNCGRYLREALESVLKQDPGPSHMQIEVVDDHSSQDDPGKLVQEIGGGRIGFFRQPENQGSLRNFETCLNRARGRWIHLLHGDDRVRDRFYTAMESLVRTYPGAGAACCRYAYINSGSNVRAESDPEMRGPGLLDNWLCRLGEKQRMQVAATIVRRDVYEKLGSFYGVTYGEDWLMWLRIASCYPVAYSPELLAEYRLHTGSISGQLFRTGQNMRDLKWVMDQGASFLPKSARLRIQRKARHFYARYALRTANSLWVDQKDRVGSMSQIREALKMYRDPGIFWDIGKIHLKMLLQNG